MHYKNEEREVHQPRIVAPDSGSMKDLDNPDSLASKTTGVLHTCIVNLPEELLLDEDSLKQKTGFSPNKTQVLLRHAFWSEYDRAVRVNEKMKAKAIFSQIVLDEMIFQKYIKDQRCLAYMLIPVKSYKVLTEGYHAYAGERMMEILSLPIRDDEGKVDHKAINQIFKIYQRLDDRINGAVVQRQQIESKVHQVTQNIPATQGRGVQELSAPQDLDAKIRELENQLKPKLLQAVNVKDDNVGTDET